MRRSILSLLALLLASSAAPHRTLTAQQPAGGPPRAAAGIGEIHGKLVDSASGRAITSGSVTIRRTGDTSFAGGALPKEDGSFRVDGLTPGSYSLRVRALGHAPFIRGGVVIAPDKPVVDVGTLTLSPVVANLVGQQVTAEREETVLQPDRTTYNTKNMTTAAGGTAIDVLRNIPQVEVDGSNKVSLRGNSNVVVQINGRATPLKGDQLGSFLAQMPANVVKNVEVAANPSAKDDPEGTAGIINIVLNQEAELGLSGGVSAGTSSTGSANGSGNVGKQQGKITAFVSGNMYYDNRNTYGTISRTNLLIPVPASVETQLSGRQNPLSGGGNVRGEYRFSDIDAITFDSYLFTGRFGGTNRSYYTDLGTAGDMIGAFNQFNESVSKNLSQDYDIAFRRQGKPGTPQLTIEGEYSNNNNTNDVDLSGIVTKSDISTPASIPTEHDHTVGTYPLYTFKTDYSYPFNPKMKLDVGVKYLDRTTTNDFAAGYLNTSTGKFEDNAAQRTYFDYNEHISSTYALFSRQFGKLQTQAGTRLEDAQTKFALPLTNQTFSKRYDSAYPSAVVSYALTDTRTAKLSYSRRVTRPYPYQLSPVEFRQDTRNVFRGNPNLNAEYTNAVDFNVLDAHSWGSLTINPFVRQTTNAVRQIQYIDGSGVNVSTFDNVAKTTTIGSSANLNYRKNKVQIGLSGNASHYKSDASNLAVGNLSVNTTQWSVNTNSTYTFNKLADMSMSAFYRPATKTEGGSSLASTFLSIGGRYKFWGDQGNMSIRLNDPFKMQKFGYTTANGSVVETGERFFGTRAIYLTITRNFGTQLRLRAKTNDDSAPTAPASP